MEGIARTDGKSAAAAYTQSRMSGAKSLVEQASTRPEGAGQGRNTAFKLVETGGSNPAGPQKPVSDLIRGGFASKGGKVDTYA